MRYFIWGLCLIGTRLSIAATNLPPEVLVKVPSNINLESIEYVTAKLELEEMVQNCGPNVVRGVRSAVRNKCSFRITLNNEYFENHRNRTGLRQERSWTEKDGVTFYEPPDRALPDSFDLRDLMTNGQPEIRQQKCSDCWAWATHHGLEISRAVHDKQVYDHSVQTVISCSHQGTCSSGGYMSAVDFLKHGLPLENEFPYVARDVKCKFGNAEIDSGWTAKVENTPYIGNSFDYSLANRNADGTFREGAKVQKMMQAMYDWKSPLVVTVAAYSISGSGIYDSCSAINSGGNHMVTIVGWDTVNGKRIAHVWNSWGQGHGEKGVSRIQWECGDGKLNRGLGVSAKIVQYKPPCAPPDASQVYMHELMVGESVKIGAEQTPTTTCSWTPTDGLDNPNSCTTMAHPTETTEYHLTAKNNCGTSSSMTLVHVWGRRGEKGSKIKTPFGYVERN